MREALCESCFGSNGSEAGENAEAVVDRAERGRGMSDLLTISEVAELLNVGEDTVTRRFAKVKGVIDLGSPETPQRRRYRVLRIPKTVVEKFLQDARQDCGADAADEICARVTLGGHGVV
jgi:hypothetical protein